jgi:hypothetical protein
LEEGRSVAYLTGTKQLAEQAAEQAELLPGLDVHLFYKNHYPAAALRAYNGAQAVGVMNYWVYFNSHPRVQPADVVIFDDAHLAEQALSGMFTLRIPRSAGGGDRPLPRDLRPDPAGSTRVVSVPASSPGRLGAALEPSGAGVVRGLGDCRGQRRGLH